jgi:hypothetical protein
MSHRAIDNVTLDLCHLEPFEVSERFGRRFDTMLDRVLDAGFRCPDDLGNAVNMVAHLCSPFKIPEKFHEEECGPER